MADGFGAGTSLTRISGLKVRRIPAYARAGSVKVELTTPTRRGEKGSFDRSFLVESLQTVRVSTTRKGKGIATAPIQRARREGELV